jgi:hypothetical protein
MSNKKQQQLLLGTSLFVLCAITLSQMEGGVASAANTSEMLTLIRLLIITPTTLEIPSW